MKRSCLYMFIAFVKIMPESKLGKQNIITKPNPTDRHFSMV